MSSNAGPPDATYSRLRDVAAIALFVVTAPLWVSFLVMLGLVYVVCLAALYVVVWAWWIGFSRERVLFVYSDSPHWKDHIERQILPRLPPDTVVLNRSQRRQWKRFSLPVLLFNTFAGAREFNPIAIVFARLALAERFRFWPAFRDARHGRRESLEELEAALFERLDRDARLDDLDD